MHMYILVPVAKQFVYDSQLSQTHKENLNFNAS